MSTRTQKDPRNLEHLSGQILAFPQSADGTYTAQGQSFGDIEMHKRTTTAETVKGKFHGQNAIATTVREDVKSLETKFELTLQEHFRETDVILFFGTDNGSVTQATATDATKTLSGVVKRGIYMIGKFGVTAVTAAVSAAAKIVGVRDLEGNIVPANADCVLDAAVGSIEILEGGTIADAADVVVTYSCPELVSRSITAGKTHKRKCRFVLTEFDGRTTPFRRQFQFDGDLTATDQGDNNPDGEINKFKFEIVISGDFTVLSNE
jgi:hypothetical protein